MEKDSDEEEAMDVAECSSCEGLTEHRILRRVNRGEGEDLLVQCVSCDGVQTLHLRPSKAIKINAILSDGPESMTCKIDSDDDEEISLDDVFEHEEVLYRVTRIDDSETRPKRNMLASEISTLWAVRCDKCILRLTMTDGEESKSETIECAPDEIFTCGSIMEIDGSKWRIRALHTGKGRTLRGKRSAIDIRRVYLHPANRQREDRRDYRR